MGVLLLPPFASYKTIYNIDKELPITEEDYPFESIFPRKKLDAIELSIIQLAFDRNLEKAGEQTREIYTYYKTVLTDAFEQSKKVTKTLAVSFEENLNVFSEAKKANYISILQESLLDGDTFDEYWTRCEKINKVVNVNWLKSEYDHAITATNAAHDYENFIKEDPKQLLRWKTRGDKRVRHEHKVLDGTTYPADHSFWKTHVPGHLSYNCRCIWVKTDTQPSKELTDLEIEEIDKNSPKYFLNNPALTKKLFTSDHPYFSDESTYGNL